MILRFVGGLSDGTAIDTDDPGEWAGVPEVPIPETLEMHSARSNRTVYRLVSATTEEAVYQIDPKLTAEYRSRSRQ